MKIVCGLFPQEDVKKVVILQPNSLNGFGCIGLYRSKITNNGPKIILKENDKENDIRKQ